MIKNMHFVKLVKITENRNLSNYNFKKSAREDFRVPGTSR